MFALRPLPCKISPDMDRKESSFRRTLNLARGHVFGAPGIAHTVSSIRSVHDGLLHCLN